MTDRSGLNDSTLAGLHNFPHHQPKEANDSMNEGNNNKPRRRRPKPKNNGEEVPKRRRKGSTGDDNICFQYAKNGTCARGEDCRFRHEAATEGTTNETNLDPQEAKGKMTVHKASKLTSANDASEDTIAAASTSTNTPAVSSHVSQERFADLKISNQSKRALSEVFAYEFLTHVQAKTLPVILSGKDCLARAKTGTGKTLAFLIPTVELLIHTNDPTKIGCLVLSPNRELAFQIHTEATSLTKFHPNLQCLAMVGGTNINKDHSGLKQKKNLQILVATPGRLLDHLQNSNLAQRLSHLKILIFDEFDQLLDQGFQPDLEKILNLITASANSRQTLLFSATMPKALSTMANRVLNKSHVFCDTVGEEEEQTHLHVKQTISQAPSHAQVTAMEAILRHHMVGDSFKIIVFFTTARLTSFMAELFNSTGAFRILEIHSRKSQSARQKASDQFRAAKSAILFSSDVSARGLDYPDVSFVLQVGLTERAQYVHRLGRSGRAGKQGGGALLVTPEEYPWMKKTLNDMPLKEMEIPPLENSVLQNAIASVEASEPLKVSAEQAYRAWLGFYNGHGRKMNWDKRMLVIKANQWAKEHGLSTTPALLRKTVGKMGLKGVPGLVLE